jgi:hypothetical protein
VGWGEVVRRQRPEPENDVDRRHMELIDEFGCAIWNVGADEKTREPSFSYSTGIWETFGAAELIVFGLRSEVARWVINEYAARAKNERFITWKRYKGFLEDFDVIFVEVDYQVASREYTTWTHWYYNREAFPLLQIVLPARSNGAFPWDPEFPADAKHGQPVLGALPN